MAEVHSWQIHPEPHAVVRQAVEALSTGRLVAFPTDTGYVLAADACIPEAVERLRRSTPGKSLLTLAVSGPCQAIEILPELSDLARRLIRRCWPGPVMLLHADVSANLDPVLQGARDARERLQVRCPAHSALLHVMQQLGDPLLIGEPAPTLPELGEGATLAIEDGPCYYPQGATTVEVQGSRWEVVHEGSISREQVQAQMARVVVFVCTGNTCRSPLAETLCKKRLADRLGCDPGELVRHGFLVLSAGVSAMGGDSAAENAVRVAQEYDVDLTMHRSQPLEPNLAYQADHLVCMTRGHMQSLLSRFPQLSCTPRLLSLEGKDLTDPIGRDEAIYRTCAAQVWQDLEPLVRELLLCIVERAS